VDLPAAFGKYELLERIATGGMAEVFLARSFGVAGFEKRLVIKRIRPELAEDPRFREMFVHEAKIAVSLNHPNVVQVYELDRVGNHLYMAMEHLHGRDLTRVVRAYRGMGSKIPLPVAVAVVAEACRGLAYAHARTDASGKVLGLVHQDVSPHNILVTFAGEVKLVDFGIARLMNTAEAGVQAESRVQGLERPGGGKYAYMSPEQARGEPLDHRSDLFSAGIVLWELIVGRRLFQDPDPSEKLRRVVEAEIPHPADLGAPIDAALWSILEKALSREREHRYASAALFEEDLRAWLFESRSRVDRADIAAVIGLAFPGEAARSPEDQPLASLVADLERLAGLDDSQTTAPPTETNTPVRARTTHPRKPVVAVMIDVDGLTDLSARIDPEQLFARHYELLRWTRRIVDRYGGVLQRVNDDHITVMFGVPRTGVDDLPRALECALELQRCVPQLERKRMKLAFAIGVHAGEVAVQNVRHRVRYVARGDTTRLARRLSSVADHGQILVSDRVRGAVDGRFSLRRGPDVPSRAGLDPIASYLVEGRPPGLRITSSRGPWLRRGDELEAFRRSVVELQNGHGSTVVITGDVGSGKSRLVREIRDLAQARGIPFFGARCATVVEDAPLGPFADLVREILDVEDRPLDRKTVTDAFGPFGLSDRDLDGLCALVGAERPKVVPERSEILHAVSRLFAALARSDAFIAAIDDLQNLRTRELEGLSRVMLATAQVPVLFLLTHRGALPPQLDGRAREIHLQSMREDQSLRLAAALLGATTLSSDLSGLIERTCEGNPLYVVEMLKWMVPDRVAVEDGEARLLCKVTAGDLPHTLAGLVSARIDALDLPAKGVLQLAAVIGATFSERLLAQAAGLEDPAPLVHDLASRGLIHRSDQGSDEWVFSSELVREASIRGILGVQRRDHHHLIARAIESLQERPGGPWAEMLVRHCTESGRMVDAARYAYAAGEDFEKQGQTERARQLFRAGLDALGRADRNPDEWDARIQGEAMLNLSYGAVCLALGDAKSGERALQVALDVASDAGLPWIETRAHLHLGRHYHYRGRNQLAAAHLGQAQAGAKLHDDRLLHREVLESLAVLAFDEGRNADCESLWNAALVLAEGDPAAVARCEIGLANRFLRSGRTDEARALLDRALSTAREAGDRVLEGRVLNNVGLLHSRAGRLDNALRYFRAALEVREGLGFTRGVVINHHNIGDVHFQRGDLARAFVAFARSRELAEEMGWARGIVLNDVFLAYIGATRGQSDVAPLEQAIERARSLSDGETTALGEWLFGRWLKENGRSDDARTRYERALAAARQSELTPMAANIERDLAGLS
jgi:serine/threonine protein kinase/tetratricopeptide (TPR) repeat protein